MKVLPQKKNRNYVKKKHFAKKLKLIQNIGLKKKWHKLPQDKDSSQKQLVRSNNWDSLCQIDLTSEVESSDAAADDRKVTVGCAVAVSIRLLSVLVFTVDAGLGVATGGCCFFFSASCKRSSHERLTTTM